MFILCTEVRPSNFFGFLARSGFAQIPRWRQWTRCDGKDTHKGVKVLVIEDTFELPFPVPCCGFRSFSPFLVRVEIRKAGSPDSDFFSSALARYSLRFFA